MTVVMERLVMFASQRGQHIRVDRRRGAGQDLAAFVNAPNRRNVVSIVSEAFAVDVTVEGLTAAFEAEWVEPCGCVSMWLADGERGREWLVVDLDGGDYPDVTLQFDAERVAAVLADIALAAFTDSTPARGAA